MENGLENIKRRKLEELNKRLEGQAQEEAQLYQQVQQLESAVKQKMTKEALQRFGNIKTAHPDKAIQLLMILARGIELGKIGIIDDTILKMILKNIAPDKRDIKIKKL